MFTEKPFLVSSFAICLVKEKTLGFISDNLGDLFMTVFNQWFLFSSLQARHPRGTPV